VPLLQCVASKSLHRLTLVDCGLLDTIDCLELSALLPTLRALEIVACANIKQISLDGGGLERVSISACGSLFEVHFGSQLKYLKEVMLDSLEQLIRISGLEAQPHLAALNISQCPLLYEVDGQPSVENLQLVNLCNLIQVSWSARLVQLDLSGSWVDTLEFLGECSGLEVLRVDGCHYLQELPANLAVRCAHLKEVYCNRSSLTSLAALAYGWALRVVEAVGCKHLVDAAALATCTNLEHVNVQDCRYVSPLNPEAWRGLRYFNAKRSSDAATVGVQTWSAMFALAQRTLVYCSVRDCAHVFFDGFHAVAGSLEQLEYLDVSYTATPGRMQVRVQVPSLPSVRTLKLSGLPCLRSLDTVDFPKLEVLKVRNAPHLRTVRVEHPLKVLDARGCPALQKYSTSGEGRVDRLLLPEPWSGRERSQQTSFGSS
jgi:hypothetical protein